MTDKVRLTVPSIELEQEYLDFYREWRQSGEHMDPRVLEIDPSDFSGMVQTLHNHSQGINLNEGWVPATTYWLVNESNRVLGAVNIRHTLSPVLFNIGGHIGYGIRPSERRKGYATKQLALALEKTAELGLDRVLVVCNERNVASAKTILKNGGVEDERFIEESGNPIRRFWITL